MNHEKIKNTFFLFGLIVLSLLLGGIVFGYLLPVLLPFLISYAIACLTTAPAARLEKKSRLSRNKLRLFISLFALLVLSLAVFLIGKYTALTLWQVGSELLEGDRLVSFIDGLFSPVESIFGDSLPPELADRITEALRGIIADLSSSLASGIGSVVGFLPKALLFLVVTLISLCYFALDLEGINGRVKSILPPQWGSLISSARERLLSVGVRYVFSYFLVMLITFSVMLLGFFILRVGHPFLIALLIAFFDLLPIIGVGTVVIPWAIVELILGNTFRGIGLLVLFVVNELIRQFSEPRIVGKNLNVHPLFTLVLIYTSIAIFGFKGIFLVPIFVAIASLFAPSREDESPKKTGGDQEGKKEG